MEQVEAVLLEIGYESVAAPAIGARWVKEKVLSVLKENYEASKKMQKEVEKDYTPKSLLVENYEDLIAIVEGIPADESPCPSLPTREEAEKWARSKFIHNDAETSLETYDWIANRFNNKQK